MKKVIVAAAVLLALGGAATAWAVGEIFGGVYGLTVLVIALYASAALALLIVIVSVLRGRWRRWRG